MKKFNYEWKLTDLEKVEKNNLKVFGTFLCGGGSSMGYKLAGFEHLGGVEIDPKMAEIYKLNHKPKYLYNMDIRDFNKLQNLPKELYELDILDGSPPCTTFSMAGNREKTWGKKKSFREGQTKQVLDDLVFVYCQTIAKLKPKVAILENVKGIIQGNAKLYTKKILKCLDSYGYKTKVFLLNAATMGVPQRRERVFFIAVRNDIKKNIDLRFNLPSIKFGEIQGADGRKISCNFLKAWEQRILTDSDFGMIYKRLGYRKCWSVKLLHKKRVCCTIISSSDFIEYNKPIYVSDEKLIKISSFPTDYNFHKCKVQYVVGMSVPPVMMAHISNAIKEQIFNNN